MFEEHFWRTNLKDSEIKKSIWRFLFVWRICFEDNFWRKCLKDLFWRKLSKTFVEGHCVWRFCFWRNLFEVFLSKKIVLKKIGLKRIVFEELVWRNNFRRTTFWRFFPMNIFPGENFLKNISWTQCAPRIPKRIWTSLTSCRLTISRRIPEELQLDFELDRSLPYRIDPP